MSFLDAILGRSKPIRASLEQLFGLSTAELTMETELGLKATGGAAICFRPVSSGQFEELQREIEALLAASTKDSPLTWRSFTDPYGYEWFVLQAQEYENAVATIHMISTELQAQGYGEQLLAAVFQFRDDRGSNVYWLYNYKRGAFYPFVPGPGQQRDNARELRVKTTMERELNIEQDYSKWYALWGIPLES